MKLMMRIYSIETDEQWDKMRLGILRDSQRFHAIKSGVTKRKAELFHKVSEYKLSRVKTDKSNFVGFFYYEKQ